MAKKLEEDMMKQRMSQPERETPGRSVSELVQRPSSKGSKSRAHTDSGSFERHERAVAGIKAEVKRESKTKEPMKKMRQTPQDDFSHLKL